MNCGEVCKLNRLPGILTNATQDDLQPDTSIPSSSASSYWWSDTSRGGQPIAPPTEFEDRGCDYGERIVRRRLNSQSGRHRQLCRSGPDFAQWCLRGGRVLYFPYTFAHTSTALLLILVYPCGRGSLIAPTIPILPFRLLRYGHPV